MAEDHQGFARDDLDRRPSVLGLGVTAEEAEVLQRQRIVNQRGKRAGISSAPIHIDKDFLPPCFPKAAPELAQLEEATCDNFLFSSLSEQQKRTIFDAMEPCTCSAGTTVITQGEIGDFFYVVIRGDLDVVKDDQLVYQYGPGGFFGELALMYDCPRAASVHAVSDCELYRLDQKTFRQVVVAGNSAKQDQLADLADRFRRTTMCEEEAADDRASRRIPLQRPWWLKPSSSETCAGGKWAVPQAQKRKGKGAVFAERSSSVVL